MVCSDNSISEVRGVGASSAPCINISMHTPGSSQTLNIALFLSSANTVTVNGYLVKIHG